MYPEIIGQFASLMKKPQLGDVDAAMDTLERFVVLLYDKTNTGSEVNMVRFDLFARKGRYVNNIPPTKGTLLQHARRAAYQAEHCWSQAIEPHIDIPRPAGWGWVGTDGGKWDVVWSNLPEASKVCRELLRCGCTKGCRANCKCVKAALTCTALCKCGGSCV